YTRSSRAVQPPAIDWLNIGTSEGLGYPDDWAYWKAGLKLRGNGCHLGGILDGSEATTENIATKAVVPKVRIEFEGCGGMDLDVARLDPQGEWLELAPLTAAQGAFRSNEFWKRITIAVTTPAGTGKSDDDDANVVNFEVDTITLNATVIPLPPYVLLTPPLAAANVTLGQPRVRPALTPSPPDWQFPPAVEGEDDFYGPSELANGYY